MRKKYIWILVFIVLSSFVLAENYVKLGEDTSTIDGYVKLGVEDAITTTSVNLSSVNLTAGSNLTITNNVIDWVSTWTVDFINELLGNYYNKSDIVSINTSMTEFVLYVNSTNGVGTGGNASFNRSLTDSLYVPYTGANQNVNLGDYNLTTKFICFNTDCSIKTNGTWDWI